ncbi:ssDNA-binding transcriptional regulator, partial [Obba rivulosa]
VQTNNFGEQYIELGPKRRVTARKYEGSFFLDIREFFGDEGAKKPGRKGIALSPEQWEVLRNNIDNIDAMFAKVKGSAKE